MQSNHSFGESRFPRLSSLRLTRNHGLLVCFGAQKTMPKQALHRLERQISLALVTLVLQTRSNGLVDEGKHRHASRNLGTGSKVHQPDQDEDITGQNWAGLRLGSTLKARNGAALPVDHIPTSAPR